jgi:hypothetical protein
MVLLRPPGTLATRITVLAGLAAITLMAAMLVGGVKAGPLAQQPQIGSGPDAENAPGPQEECPDAEIVHERLATGDLETNLFETSTDRFIVSYEVLQLQPGQGMPSFHATIEDEDGQIISSGYIPSPHPGDPVRIDLRPNMGRTIVDAEPGSYRVAISPSKSDRRYAVTVEECGV